MKKQILFFFVLLGCLVFNYSTAQINYQWAKSIGSSVLGDDEGQSIVIDDSGSVYVTGKFYSGSTNFNPYGTPSVSVSNTDVDCFFAKYNSNGNCIWAAKLDLEVNGRAAGKSIAVDAAHNVYVSGIFTGTVDFDPDTLSSYSLTSLPGGALGVDCFVAKYDPAGSFQWVKRFGGNGDDIVTGISVVGSGAGIFLTGFFESDTIKFYSGFSTVDSALSNSTGGDNNIFFVKYDSASTFQWAKSIGGTGEDMAMAIDANDSWVTITGSFQGIVDFGSGTGNIGDTIFAGGAKDAFFAKFDLNGYLAWAYGIIGQSGSEAIGTGVAMDANNINITGVFKGTIDFPDPQTPFSILDTKTAVGRQDIFFAKYMISHSFNFAKKIGGNDNQADSASASAIAVDSDGNIYLTGAFKGQVDFNPFGGNNIVSSGNTDIFFAEYDELGTEKWAKKIGANDKDIAFDIAVNNSENVFLTGTFRDTVNFDPGAGTANRVSVGNFGTDIFIAKYREGSSTIKGHVTRSSNGDAISIGYNNYVSLYAQTVGDGNAAMHLVDTVKINSSGDYIFTELCADNYIVLAITGIDYLSVVPTYYGDVTHWDQATSITTLPNTIDTADIVMAEYLAITGDAKIGGRIVGENGFDRTVKPISGIPVGLEGDPGSIIISHTVTDEEGYYSFTNIPADTCYKIYVNIPGLPIVSNYHACPQSSDSIMTLDFVADSVSIDTVPGVINSVLQMPSFKTKLFLYPNPNKGFTTIEFTMVESKWVHIEVYNLLGGKVAELLNEQKQAGTVKFGFNAADKGLKAGIYLINLRVGDEMIVKKIVQIE
ncbi:MAG: T9SS type A sorting domain-containing protein [Bacteroidetes bacterium]|nr:T9SS type A sorting domain-containing protein [Bacteroidota bacterium]